MSTLSSYYNWDVNPPDVLPSGITYMPMLWGWKNAASFAQTVGNTVHSTIALGMNECVVLHPFRRPFLPTP